jgi:hypothetical protein
MEIDVEIDEFDELNQKLARANLKKMIARRRGQPIAVAENPSYGQDEDKAVDFGKLCQFTTGDGTRFFPAGRTVERVPPGVYEIHVCNMKGVYFQKIPVKTEGLLRFPETNSEKVIDEIHKFWNREEAFLKFDLCYKRGIILWGPPGSGKSCTIQLVMADVIERGGVCFKFTAPGLFCEGLRSFREIQPDTEVVVLMEDIDSIIDNYSESEVLNLLDGVDQVEKVVYLATTNYPEHLGARILNRPSRFDKRFKMGHPKKASRKLYFQHLMDAETLAEYNVDLDRWVKDTDDMSIAHLKELFISVCILGNNYSEAIRTLRSMVETRPKSSDDDYNTIGFGPGERYDDDY